MILMAGAGGQTRYPGPVHGARPQSHCQLWDRHTLNLEGVATGPLPT